MRRQLPGWGVVALILLTVAACSTVGNVFAVIISGS